MVAGASASSITSDFLTKDGKKEEETPDFPRASVADPDPALFDSRIWDPK
jgi:hypothetical protein